MEEILISLVRECPWLYDFSRADFRDNEKKENSWKKIATALNLDAVEVKKKWKNLRSSFVREKRITPSGSSGGKKKEWIYMQCLSFLAGHVKEKKKTYSNFSAPNIEVPLNIDFNTDMETPSTFVIEEEVRVLQSTPMSSTSYTPMASTSCTPMASTSCTPMASTSCTPMASTSCTPMASTSKRQQDENLFSKKNKRRRIVDHLQKSLEATDELIQRELSAKKNLSQSFSDVLELLLDKVSDSRKVEVMIKLLSVVQEELNKEND